MKLLRKRSVDTIVGPLSKIVADLDAHAAAQERDSAIRTTMATKLLSKAADHATEAARARAARNKIASLIG